jgi:hypothetical protein
LEDIDMSQIALTRRRDAAPPRTGRGHRLLLAGGTLAGPLFIGVALLQILTRQGFDLGRQPISLLSLGDRGWVQIANFELTGLFAIGGAVGLRQALRSVRAATWGPLCFGIYGLGLILAGIFHPDPSMGFPPGAPQGMPAAMSWHAIVHQLAFFLSFLALIAGCVVFALRFGAERRRVWTAYCVATALAPLPLIALSAAMGGSGLPLFAMGVVTSTWVAAIPASLLRSDGGAES